MGLMPSTLRLVIKLHGRRGLEGPVCSLGNQEIWATYEDLRDFFRHLGVSFKTPEVIRGHSSRTFLADPALAALAKDFVHARTFFEMLGIREYEDVDRFDWDQPTRLHDLNLPIPQDLLDRFGLVLDGGTAEHIFDVRQVLTSVVHMLRPGGQVIHIASFEPDHGFYAFSPCLFFDFYQENGFSDLECYLLQFDYRNIIKNFAQRSPCFRYAYGMSLRGLFNGERSTLVIFLARKEQIVFPTRIPTQGVFAQRASGTRASAATPNVRGELQISLYETKLPRWLQTAFSPLRPWLRRFRAAWRGRRRAAGTPKPEWI